jgi:glycosyltransferase involved in cell wall biosynthesis
LPKLLIIVNDVRFFISHRLPLAIAARDSGYDVAVAAPSHPTAEQIVAEGIAFYDLPLPRKRGAIISELRGIVAVWKLLALTKPNVVHLVTAKPIIFGGIISRLRRVPALAAISGLGHVFIFDDFKSRIARRALLLGYSLALRRRRRVLTIFQNTHNLELFQKAGIVGSRYILIRGSGTRLADFNPAPSNNGSPVVLLPARMLWTKGVAEFVEAARMLRARGCSASFVLAGAGDPGNPANIEDRQLRAWNTEGVVEWIGHQSDVARLLKETDIVVLPSYLEGLPKTIVDAAAAGRPCVTTDVPGCRDAIIDGVTGLLCRARDAEDLAEKIALLLANPDLRSEMSRQARLFAEREFNLERVIEQHLECYRTLISDLDLDRNG